ncbi:MAG: hypothetical protein R3C14_50170 [Caldilineaceae bacterium]
MSDVNEFLFAGLFGLFIASVPVILLSTLIIAQLRLSAEQGKTPIFTQTSGGRVGWLNYRGPFIRLSLYEEFLVIRCWQSIVLRYDEIDRVELPKWFGLIGDGVRIVHHGQAPIRIHLGSGDATRLKNLIEARLPHKPPPYIEPHYRLR